MIMDILGLQQTVQKNKIVIVTHTQIHDPNSLFGLENLEKLRKFLMIANAIGYEFRTVDTYSEDVVPESF